MQKEIALEARRLSVTRGGRVLLDEVDVALKSSKITVVLGANGAGKSTLIRCLAGGLVPAEGEVLVEGESLRGMNRLTLARKVAYLPQSTPTAFGFTVEETIGMGSRVAGFTGVGSVETLLERFGLQALRRRSLLSLSGGECARVHLARVWAQGTPILLLDEPVANLDVRYQRELLALIKEGVAETGKTVLLTLHDLNLVTQIAEDVILMQNGAIVSQGTVEEALTESRLKKVYETRINRIQSGNRSFFYTDLLKSDD